MNEQFEKGLKVRKAVLGEEYVEKSLNSANHFTQAMQQLTTEWCWGEVWTREGLPEDEEHYQPLDADGAQPPARDLGSRARRDQQWLVNRRDQGGFLTDRHLLRSACGNG